MVMCMKILECVGRLGVKRKLVNRRFPCVWRYYIKGLQCCPAPPREPQVVAIVYLQGKWLK